MVFSEPLQFYDEPLPGVEGPGAEVLQLEDLPTAEIASTSPHKASVLRAISIEAEVSIGPREAGISFAPSFRGASNGSAQSAAVTAPRRTRNLEIPGSMLRIAPE